jgi:hypothetical protein
MAAFYNLATALIGCRICAAVLKQAFDDILMVGNRTLQEAFAVSRRGIHSRIFQQSSDSGNLPALRSPDQGKLVLLCWVRTPIHEQSLDKGEVPAPGSKLND